MLREIRVRNLTSSLFGNMGLTEVAEALLLQNLRGTPARRQLTLAGQLAGIQFEREVMELATAAIENNKGTDYEGRLRDICKDRDGRLSRMVRSGLELPSNVRQRWGDCS